MKFDAVFDWMKKLQKAAEPVNNSKYFAGLAMIMLNIGSRYVTIHLSPTQKEMLKNGLARQLLIFSIAWIGSRDLVTSLIITAAFVVLADFLLNERSALCILPKHMRRLRDAVDANGDGVIDEDEINQAIKVLERAKKLPMVRAT
jgi:hypothetical protein